MRNDRFLRPALLTVVAIAMVAGCGSEPAQSAPAPDSATAGPRSPSNTIRYAVEGVVQDGEGRPVAGVPVLAVSLDTPSNAVPELPIYSDSQGRYAWPSLKPGRYELRASGPAGSGSVQVTVHADGPVNGNLVLRRAG